MKNAILKGMTVSLAMGAGMTAFAADYSFKFQGSEPAGSVNHGYYEAWAKNVNEMSNGRVEIAILPAGSVVKHTETLDAVGSGILDGHVTACGYFTGLDAAFGLLCNSVGAWSSAGELGKFYYSGGGKELLNELYKPYNVYNFGMITPGLEAFVSKKKLNGIEDLKGLKLRAPEGMVSAVFKAAGARPVNLPGSEVYTALDKGVIDAADYSTFNTNQEQGLHKIAKNPVYPGFHSMPLIDMTINADKWKALPADLKSIMETSAKAMFVQMAYDFEIKDGKAVKKHLANGGQLTNWSAEDRVKFRGYAASEWKKYAKKSKNAEKVYAKLTTFLKDNGLLK